MSLFSWLWRLKWTFSFKSLWGCSHPYLMNSAGPVAFFFSFPLALRQKQQDNNFKLMYKADQVFSAKQWNVPNMPNQPCDPNSTNHVFYLLRIRQMGKRQKFLKTSEKEWWLHYRPGRASSGCLLIFVVSKLQRIHKLKPYISGQAWNIDIGFFCW